MIPTKEEMLEALNIRHGKELQSKISETSVAVCGLGGLGSNVAIALARAGIGHLHLIDFDQVDLTNLNRQQYMVNQLGMNKTDALKQTLELIAPYCKVTTECRKITGEDISKLFEEDDIICEAFDRPEEKAMLVTSVLEYYPKKPLVAASGMAGLDSGNLIQTKRISKNFYLCGDGVSDVEDGLGLVSARVLICAAHEATMILRLIAGEEEP